MFSKKRTLIGRPITEDEEKYAYKHGRDKLFELLEQQGVRVRWELL